LQDVFLFGLFVLIKYKGSKSEPLRLAEKDDLMMDTKKFTVKGNVENNYAKR